MTVTRWPISSMVVGFTLAVSVCLLLSDRDHGAAAAQGDKKDLTRAKFIGVTKCAFCHRTPGDYPTDLVLVNEVATWRSKDKHALAWVILEGPRGKHMADILGFDVTKDTRCLNCHSTTSRPDRGGDQFKYYDGVSCDGCHGPAEHWITPHFSDDGWRKKTPQQKEDLGLFDLRNPVKRTQLCMSCHVGNTSEGKVVTHEMYAAGHPPLPSFETASFSLNLPPHWKDIKDVEFFNNKKTDPEIKKQNYGEDAAFQQTKLVMASCSESLRSMMEVVANRANHSLTIETKQYAWPPIWLRPHSKNEPHDRWPETVMKEDGKKQKAPTPEDLNTLWPEIAMAQADCFSCHHDLKSKSWRRERGYTGAPGRPQLQPWPFALASMVTKSEDEPELKEKTAALAKAMNSQPFGNPKAVAEAARNLEHFSAKMMQPTSIVTKDTAGKLLKMLLARGAAKYTDYDSARQIAWATRVVLSEWDPELFKKTEVAKVLEDLDNELNLTTHSKARKGPIGERHDLTKEFKENLKADVYEAKVRDKDFLKKLQDINDRELTEAMKVVSSYDPDTFRTRMESLSALISAKGKAD